jgi:hypothetical protein
MPRDENGDLLVYDPMSWRALLGGVLVAVAAWMATRALFHAERAITGNTNYGYTPDPAGTREFLSELDKPNFRQAGADAVAKAKGIDTFLYRAADKASRAVYGKPFAPWNQGQAGTCVGNAWAMGSWTGQSVSWAAGELPTPPKMVSVEAVYGGSRTFGRLPPVLSGAGYSDGSYGAAAARWVAGRCKDPTVGGILYREKYGNVDLSHYSIPLCREWGNSGVPLELARLAHEHTATAVALINDYDSLVASLESGFPVAICSNVGYAATNVRDSMGYLPRGGQWNHAMVAVACRHAATSGRDGVLILNSWGDKWVGGPKWPPDQPDGSFWITKADATSMIAQGDSFAIGSVGGFKYRDLHNGNWMEAK